MDRGFTARQFVGQLEGAASEDRQIVRTFASEFGGGGRRRHRRGEVTTAAAYSAAPVFCIKGGYLIVVFVILSYVDRRYGGRNRFLIFERAPG